MFLYHYFYKGRDPFLTLSDLSDDDAVNMHKNLEKNYDLMVKRNFDGKYVINRRMVENWLYGAFMKKDGKPERKTPYYMTLGKSNFYKNMDCDFIEIPLNEFNMDTVSFTYGDSFPTFFSAQFGDKSEYVLNVYTNNEIWDIIKKYGNPQWTAETQFYEPHYIEAQIWSDKIIEKYK
jgi:hypothetical protein